jgi:hypothetical protein
MLRKKKQLFSTNFYRIAYFVPAKNIRSDFEFHESLRKVCPQIEILARLPNESDISSNKLPKLFIFDDLAREILDYKNNFDDMFTTSSHHQSLSIIYTVQNYFTKSTTLDIIRNCTHQILFYPNEINQLRSISCKYFSSSKFLENCFDELSESKEKKNIYLMIEMESISQYPKGMNLRSDILPDENGKFVPIVFFNKKFKKSV